MDTNDLDKSQTNESDLSLSEWHIVSSKEDQESPKEHQEEVAVLNSSEKDEEDLPKGCSDDDIFKGSSVDVVLKGSSVEDVPLGSSIEDVVEEQENRPQSESSCSSSDIDIIDEGSLDYIQNSISIPSIELSLSSSFETDFSAPPPALSVKEGTSPALPVKECTPPPALLVKECTPPPALPVTEYTHPVREYTPEPVTDIVVQRDRLQRNPYFIMFCIGGLLAIFMHIPETPVDIIKEMEKRIMTLQEENKGLKSQVTSKIEDDKLFVSLEEQIKALKGENSKLSRFMKDLIHQLEEKTIIFKEESEIKGKESYQNEIDKLKEQVNILQIDNDELQKQLVRMRYGVYSPRAQDSKSPDASHKEESSDDESENSTEILSEEIKELRKKLYSEVEKLKNWKESVQHLMKELENRPKEFDKKQESGDKDKAFKKNKEKSHKGSLKDANSDPNQITQFNLTDLVFRYIGVDKKKVKDVFESVGHYFKKAQERTKDIFDENVKNDMWNFIGGLRKQWHMMKKAYFPKHAKKAHTQDDDYKQHSTEKYTEKSEGNLKKDSTFQSKHGDKSWQEAQEKGRKLSQDNQHIKTKDEFKKEQSGRVPENSKWKAHHENLENLAEATASLDSWLFERAAHRSELRGKEEEEVNWYLKNRKADFLESDNLKQDESTDDPYENIDLFAMD